VLVPILALASSGSAQSISTLRQQIVSACQYGDDKALLAGLQQMATANNAEALNDAVSLLHSQVIHQRQVGVDILQRYAPASLLRDLASTLDASLYRDERRQLISALAQRHSPEVMPALEKLLRDPDRLVAASAAAGIASQGDVTVVGLLFDPMPSFHDYTDVDGSGDDQIYAFNALGAIRALCNHEKPDSSALLAWFHNNEAQLAAEARSRASAGNRSPSTVQPKPETNPIPVGGKYFGPGFYYTFNPPDAQNLLASRLHLATVSDWQKFERDIEQSAALDRQLAAPIFGLVHVPYCRLKFATHQTVAADGGVSEGYGGFGGHNRITVDTDLVTPLFWPTLIRHEYVHVLNGFAFSNTPRWLAEGLAVSLSESPRRTSWTPQRVARSGLTTVIEQGGITADVNWTNGASSGGPGEAPQYALAGLVIDYLRFGDISLPNHRLFALLGAMDRGVQPETAVEAVYGRTMRQMDQDFAKWVTGLATPRLQSPPQAPASNSK
jgi:hypothetical protein